MTMIKKSQWMSTVCIVLAWLTVSIGSLQAQSAILGKWHHPEKGGIILIYEEGGKYYGQLIGSANAEEDQLIKSQEQKMVLFRDFEQKSDTKWCCGTILQPKENNRELKGTLILENDQTMKVIGRMGIFSGTTYWKKV